MSSPIIDNLKLYLQSSSLSSASTLPPCNYYTEHEFQDGYNRLDRRAENLSVFHLNIRSLNANHSKKFQFIAALNFPFDVMFLSEIWTYNISMYSNLFPDFNFYYRLPLNSSIGGVGAFIHKSFTVIERKNISFKHTSSDGLAELLFLEISKLSVNCLLGGFYRHPSTNISQFTSSLETLIQSSAISRYKSHCFLIGDFNVDLLKFKMQHEVSGFLDMLINYNFMPASVLPTRITDSPSTLIDHIYYRSNINNLNSLSNAALNGCLVTDITDHLANILILPLSSLKSINTHRPLIRIFSATNKATFLNELHKCDWASLVYNQTDVDAAYRNFNSTLHSKYEVSFPLTRLSRKRSKDKKWVTPDIIKCINRKNSLYKRCILSKNPIVKENYKTYLKIFNSTVKAAQNSYYMRTFDANANSIKTLLKEINNLCCFDSRKSKVCTTISKLNLDGNSVSDPILMADSFNKYFCNVGPKLVSQLPTLHNNRDFASYLPPSISNTFFCESIFQSEIYNLIAKFKSKYSSGPDVFNARLIFDIEPAIISPLCFIYNLSLSTGTFPTDLKIAKTIPIYIKGDHSTMGNYRPISLLSIFSKILESLVSSRLTSFFTKFNVLYEYQFGFRSNYSTKLALINSIDDILKSLAKKITLLEFSSI